MAVWLKVHRIPCIFCFKNYFLQIAAKFYYKHHLISFQICLKFENCIKRVLIMKLTLCSETFAAFQRQSYHIIELKTMAAIFVSPQNTRVRALNMENFS